MKKHFLEFPLQNRSTTMKTKRFLEAAILIALALTFFGCGDSGGGAPSLTEDPGSGLEKDPGIALESEPASGLESDIALESEASSSLESEPVIATESEPSSSSKIEPVISSSSSEAVSIPLPKCGGAEYDPDTQFCFDNATAAYKCAGNPQEYDPALYGCKEGKNGVYLKTPEYYEGEHYEAVLIGTQTWFARNLNYAAPGSYCGISDTNPNRYLTTENTEVCEKYGRLYYWAAAMGIDESHNAAYFGTVRCPSDGFVPNFFCIEPAVLPHKGICPEGWHVPTSDEWNDLKTYINDGNSGSGPRPNTGAGKKLRASNDDWYISFGTIAKGTDDFGFAALAAGYGNPANNNKFSNPHEETYWWSASEYGKGMAWAAAIVGDSDLISRDTQSKNLFPSSVRCLKD
jgi:uncharacterized protein (TIGR02145 family)